MRHVPVVPPSCFINRAAVPGRTEGSFSQDALVTSEIIGGRVRAEDLEIGGGGVQEENLKTSMLALRQEEDLEISTLCVVLLSSYHGPVVASPGRVSCALDFDRD